MTPLEPDYHPEVDTSPLLDDDRTNYYQSMIGILLWASELGCIDITQEVGLMARFGALPREGHFDTVVRMFAYLKKHLHSRLVYDTKPVDLSDIDTAHTRTVVPSVRWLTVDFLLLLKAAYSLALLLLLTIALYKK